MPPHRNPGLELVLVENGEVTWDYGGQQVRTPPGHVSFSWPWQTHGAWRERLEMVELYWVMLPLRSGGRVVATPRPHPDLLPLQVVQPQWSALRQRSHPVLRLRPAGRKAFIAAVRGLAGNHGVPDAAAWGQMLLLFAEIDQALRTEAEGGRGQDLERVRRWMDGLSGHLGEAWTLERMAEACGMGRTRFAEAVKHVYGDTPMRLLARMRVEEGARRLRETEDRVGEIADAVGFASPHYFATVCRRYTGRAPTELRRTPDAGRTERE